jgi:hypothetical protein
VRVPWILLPAERPQARWGRVHWKLIGALLCSLLIAAGIALSDETVHGIAQAAFAPKLFVAPSVEPILVKASRIARNPPKSTPNSPKPKDLK